MKKLTGVLTWAIMTVFVGAAFDRNAEANLITEVHNIAMNGPNAVSYTFFSVTTAGTFNISADGQPVFTLMNPQIYLFTDNGSPIGALTGTFINADDDSGPGANSLIANQFLAVGKYVVAVGASFFNQSAAQIGTSVNTDSGTVQVGIASTNGVANLGRVPEPASFMLLGFGLLAFRFALRRSRD